MAIMVYSLLWVLQDLHHQRQYCHRSTMLAAMLRKHRPVFKKGGTFEAQKGWVWGQYGGLNN